MQNYYQKNITKFLQIFAAFKNGELSPMYTGKKEVKYTSIEKLTLFFQNEDENIPLFGNRIFLSIFTFFPCVKIISFKNINFQSDNKKFRKDFDDIYTSFTLILFGEKNIDLQLFKNKDNCLKEIKFYNCYFYNDLLDKDILKDIENKINSYLGQNKIKVSFIE